MSYTPINIPVYIAAYCGALAGMGASNRVPSSPDSVSYDALADEASGFAQAFDTVWNDASYASDLQSQAIQSLCQSAWQERTPPNSALFETTGPYTTLATALIAMVVAADENFSGNSIPANVDYALAQPLWYISFLTGNDSNTGITLSAPLKTFAELVRRWGTASPTLTASATEIVIIDHDVSDTIYVRFFMTDPFGTITIRAHTNSVLQGGTYTATRVKDTATNTPPGLTDSAISGGTWPFGSRIKTTSGPANGAYSWCLKDEGAQVARTTNASIDFVSVLQPLVTNTYIIETLTVLYVGGIAYSGGGDYYSSVLYITDLHLSGDLVINNTSNWMQFERCRLSGSLTISTTAQLYFMNCLLTPGFYGINCLKAKIKFEGGGGIGIDANTPFCIFDESIIVTGDGASEYIGQNLSFVVSGDSTLTGTALGSFDCEASTENPNGDGLVLGCAGPSLPGTGNWIGLSIPGAGRVWGAGHAGFGFSLGSESSFTYSHPIYQPTITGTDGDWSSASVGSVQQGIGYNDTTMAVEGPFANTYANLVAASPGGFEGNAFDLRTGAKVNVASRVFT